MTQYYFSGFSKTKALLKGANTVFHLECNDTADEIIFIERVHIHRPGHCSKCKNRIFCRDSGLKAKFSILCENKSVCDVNGSQFLDLSDPCLKRNLFIDVTYKCSEGRYHILAYQIGKYFEKKDKLYYF